MMFSGETPYLCRLAVQDDVLRGNTVPLPEVLERGVDVRINVLFRGLPAGGAVTAVVVREYVHPQPCGEADVERGHLTEVDGVSVAEEQGVLAPRSLRRALGVHAGHLVAARRSHQEHLK